MGRAERQEWLVQPFPVDSSPSIHSPHRLSCNLGEAIGSGDGPLPRLHLHPFRIAPSSLFLIWVTPCAMRPSAAPVSIVTFVFCQPSRSTVACWRNPYKCSAISRPYSSFLYIYFVLTLEIKCQLESRHASSSLLPPPP